MINTIRYISIHEVLSRLLRHPLLQSVDLEAAIQYTLDFMDKVGLPDMYIKKEAEVHIEDYRGTLPCDLIYINLVKDKRSDTVLRSTTDGFSEPSSHRIMASPSYRTNNRTIFTSIKDGDIIVSYNAIQVDEEELPMLPDIPAFLSALELYIKKEYFTILFDVGKIDINVLNKAEQDYSFQVGQCISLFHTPSYAEMQSITGMMHRLIPSTHEFGRGFKTLGDTEYFKRH